MVINIEQDLEWSGYKWHKSGSLWEVFQIGKR